MGYSEGKRDATRRNEDGTCVWRCRCEGEGEVDEAMALAVHVRRRRRRRRRGGHQPRELRR